MYALAFFPWKSTYIKSTTIFCFKQVQSVFCGCGYILGAIPLKSMEEGNQQNESGVWGVKFVGDSRTGFVGKIGQKGWGS